MVQCLQQHVLRLNLGHRDTSCFEDGYNEGDNLRKAFRRFVDDTFDVGVQHIPTLSFINLLTTQHLTPSRLPGGERNTSGCLGYYSRKCTSTVCIAAAKTSSTSRGDSTYPMCISWISI